MTHEVVILAAGQGTRMRSKLPKVLHTVAGKAMLRHVVDSSKKIGAKTIHVVIGHGAEVVKQALSEVTVNWVLQTEQLGTGHAVAQALPYTAEDTIVLIAYGDVPLVQVKTLEKLVAIANKNTLSLLTVNLHNPGGYGRIVRNSEGAVTKIIEQKDASETELLIQEVNTGMMAVPVSCLKKWLPALSSNNAQSEYYLTDIISMAVADEVAIETLQPEYPWEVQGANDREQVSQLERHYQYQQAKSLMAAGASLADPNRIDVRGELKVAQDVSIDINCVFIGKVELAEGVSIGPNCIIENSTIGCNTQVKANSIIEQSSIDEDCDIGPFARLRPGTQLAKKAKIGNFVETKKAIVGAGSKVNHLSYIGDCVIGTGANIGAGTITCNYDGVNKHQTTIGDGAFIGSNTALVAPVNIAALATVAAGSTITADVEEKSLAVARAKQRQIKPWKRPEKKS